MMFGIVSFGSIDQVEKQTLFESDSFNHVCKTTCYQESYFWSKNFSLLESEYVCTIRSCDANTIKPMSPIIKCLLHDT